jgi:hypothetical protein
MADLNESTIPHKFPSGCVIWPFKQYSLKNSVSKHQRENYLVHPSKTNEHSFRLFCWSKTIFSTWHGMWGKIIVKLSQAVSCIPPHYAPGSQGASFYSTRRPLGIFQNKQIICIFSKQNASKVIKNVKVQVYFCNYSGSLFELHLDEIAVAFRNLNVTPSSSRV